MAYTKFRFISWEIPTVIVNSNTNKLVSGFDPGDECDPVDHIPVPGGLLDDAKVRLLRLAKVVDSTLGKLKSFQDDTSTLKIFLLPEFYFRPPSSGTTGDTPHGTYKDLEAMKVLKALNTMFTDKRFADWLLVCGTMMWNTSTDLIAQTLYYNTAILVRGGRKNGMWIVEKRLASHIDGVPREYAPGEDKAVKRYLESWSHKKKHVFDVDGISCGVEVCLDHFQHKSNVTGILYPATLKQVLREWSQYEGHSLSSFFLGGAAREVRLHILTAGGMEIDANSVAASPKGFILRNDGITNSGDRSEMRLVASYEKQDGTSSTSFEPAANSKAVMSKKTPLATYNIPSGSMRIPIPSNHESFTQCVKVFPLQSAV